MSKLVSFLSLLWLACLVLPLLLGACSEAGGRDQHPKRIQSVTFDAVGEPDLSTLEHLRDMGVTHLTLVSFGFQPGYDVPEIRLHNDARWFSESDSGIRTLARQADSLGMQIILKPHLWVRRQNGEDMTLSAVGFETEADWQEWEAQYRTFIMHYAHLAQEINAPLLVIGTELANVARTRPDFWRGLIADIRPVYDGALTYAANWWEEYQHITFWDDLDYIGVQAYFELSKAQNPTAEVLRAGWEAPEAALRQLSEQTGKPVLFTEIGYRSVSYAAAQPWRWPSRAEADTSRSDEALQALLYEAFFETLWQEPWFAGIIVWKWHPPSDRRRRDGHLDFTPQNKPAEQVIARWFTGKAVPATSSQ